MAYLSGGWARREEVAAQGPLALCLFIYNKLIGIWWSCVGKGGGNPLPVLPCDSTCACLFPIGGVRAKGAPNTPPRVLAPLCEVQRLTGVGGGGSEDRDWTARGNKNHLLRNSQFSIYHLPKEGSNRTKTNRSPGCVDFASLCFGRSIDLAGAKGGVRGKSGDDRRCSIDRRMMTE